MRINNSLAKVKSHALTFFTQKTVCENTSESYSHSRGSSLVVVIPRSIRCNRRITFPTKTNRGHFAGIVRQSPGGSTSVTDMASVGCCHKCSELLTSILVQYPVCSAESSRACRHQSLGDARGGSDSAITGSLEKCRERMGWHNHTSVLGYAEKQKEPEMELRFHILRGHQTPSELVSQISRAHGCRRMMRGFVSQPSTVRG